MKTSSKESLTSKQKDALRSIKEGADVTGYELAKTLRQIESTHPHLITITKVMGNYGDGSGREPYFGAIPTAAGLAAIA